MIDSRDANELLPIVKAMCLKHIIACAEAGIKIILTSTYRDIECQNLLYAQGRTAPGSIVTNAKGGMSYHNYRCAYDVLILRNGKPVWETTDPNWRTVGELGEKCGLSWAGRWKGKLKETAHFQFTGGLALADLKAGRIPDVNS